ncbi:MAG: hypothetical protein AAFP07_14215 [Cyanobacteria bacterium J06606_4]
MSHSPASRTSTASRRSRRKATRAAASAPQPTRKPTQKPIQPPTQKRLRSGSQRSLQRSVPSAPVDRGSIGGESEPFLSPHRRKVLWAGGAIALLAMATVLPTQVSSQAIPQSNCEQVIKSGAEISRGQISQLLAVPEGASKEAVRQVALDPYCTLPVITTTKPSASAEEGRQDLSESAAEKSAEVTLEREAYPLAFDREAWVVLTYEGDAYMGYDFVFKP